MYVCLWIICVFDAHGSQKRALHWIPLNGVVDGCGLSSGVLELNQIHWKSSQGVLLIAELL